MDNGGRGVNSERSRPGVGVIGAAVVAVAVVVTLLFFLTRGNSSNGTITGSATPTSSLTSTGPAAEVTLQRGGNLPQAAQTSTAIANIQPTPKDGTPAPNVATVVAAATTSGTNMGRNYVVDSGYRPQPDGYSFVNFGVQYPKEPGSLTIDDLRRMFGDAAVCGVNLNDKCIPRPAAVLWMDKINRGSRAGVCEGLVVTSLRMYNTLDNPSAFGSATGKVGGLQVTGNDKLLHQIGYYFALQAVEPVAGTAARSRSMSPSEILDAIIAGLSSSATGHLTLGIYQSGKGGHSLMPYAVEDAGDGLYRVFVYDPNFPNVEKYVEINRSSNTWQYSHDTTDPADDVAPWTGTATSRGMDITTLAVRDETLVCPWCGQKGAGAAGTNGQKQDNFASAGKYSVQLASQKDAVRSTFAQGQTPETQLWLDGGAHALIKDAQGNRLGFVNNDFVSEIPGAYSVDLRTGLGINQEPVYVLPNGGLDVTLDGQSLSSAAATDLAYFGAGMSAEISGISLDANQQDHLLISGSDGKLVYEPSGEEKPVFKIAPDLEGADYLLEVSGLDVNGGDNLSLSYDPATKQLAVHSSDTDPETYDLKVTRIDSSGPEVYTNEDIVLDAGSTEYVEFGDWTGSGPMDVGVDSNSDGTIDQTESEPDEDINEDVQAEATPEAFPTDESISGEATETPEETAVSPDDTPLPDETAAPENTTEPTEETVLPEETAVPEETVEPEATVAPEETPQEVIPEENAPVEDTPEAP